MQKYTKKSIPPTPNGIKRLLAAYFSPTDRATDDKKSKVDPKFLCRLQNNAYLCGQLRVRRCLTCGNRK